MTASRRTPIEARISTDDVLAAEVKGGLLAHPGNYIRRLHQISVAVFLEQTADHKITQVQFAALETVNFAAGIDQARLGKLIALDRQTISNVVRRLCEKGLLIRKQKDGRTNELHVTPAARKVLASMRSQARGVGDIVLSPLSKAERQIFTKLLVKVVEENNALSRAPYLPLDQ
jgi:DNA-binding MarR family transcriptional regulator